MITIKAFIDYLQKFTNFDVTQSKIGEALKTSRSNISHRVRNKSELSISEVRQIVEYLKIPKGHDIINGILKQQGRYFDDTSEVLPEIQEDTIELDYYPSVFGSCGTGTFVFSEEKQAIAIPRRCLRNYSTFKNYSVINARGDSMSPYIMDRDKLIVEHWNGEQISDNRIYVFRFYDNIFVKRLVLNLDQIVVKSDNKEYQTRNIEKAEADNFQIIGRIVGIWREEI